MGSGTVLGAVDEILDKTGEAPALSAKWGKTVTKHPPKYTSGRVSDGNTDHGGA